MPENLFPQDFLIAWVGCKPKQPCYFPTVIILVIFLHNLKLLIVVDREIKYNVLILRKFQKGPMNSG